MRTVVTPFNFPPQGRPGAGLGPTDLAPFQGPPGKSAYDLWVEAGNVGTVADFLASLVSTVPGPPGYAKRFGTIDYTDNDAGSPLTLPAGKWVRVMRNLTPSQANYNLPSGPWAGFAFWDNANSLLRARARGDAMLIKFTFTVIPDQQAGGVRFAVRPGDNPAFDFGPEPIVLTSDAGEAQTGSETFFVQCRPRFVDQGAQVYIMATTGGTLMQFSPEITPLDFAA